MLLTVASAPPTSTFDTSGFTIHSIGATEYRSALALQKLLDWAEWRDAVLPELQHAIEVKKGLTFFARMVTSSARAGYTVTDARFSTS